MTFQLSIKYETMLVDYCLNISMEAIFMNTENNKTSEPHKFVLNLTRRLDLRGSNKHVALLTYGKI